MINVESRIVSAWRDGDPDGLRQALEAIGMPAAGIERRVGRLAAETRPAGNPPARPVPARAADPAADRCRRLGLHGPTAAGLRRAREL